MNNNVLNFDNLRQLEDQADIEPPLVPIRQTHSRVPNARLREVERAVARRASDSELHRDLLKLIREVKRWRRNPVRTRSYVTSRPTEFPDEIFDLFERRPYASGREFQRGVWRELGYPITRSDANRWFRLLTQAEDDM